jgi:hypothetical protein
MEEYVIKKNEVDVRLILDGISGHANPYLFDIRNKAAL